MLTGNLVLAEDMEQIYLEEQSVEKINQFEYSNPNVIRYDKFSDDVDLRVNDFNKSRLYESKTITNSKDKKIGDFSFGTQMKTTLNSESYSCENSYYTKYQKDKFGMQAGYKNNGFAASNNGTVSLTPEYKLNDKFSIQNAYSAGISGSTKKGEVNLNIKPFKDDRMDLNVGAGQVFTDNTSSSSRVNFSTKFNF